MTVVTIHEAKTQLSKLIAAAEAGEEIVIARGKDPVVRLEPIKAVARGKPVPGTLKGKVFIDERFFEPLPEEELAAWEGAYSRPFFPDKPEE